MTRIEDRGRLGITSTTTVDGPAPASSSPASPPSVRARPAAIVRRVAWIVFVLQLIGLMVWSAVLYSRYSITHDGGQYIQSLYLTVHGHLYPFSTIEGHAALKDHFTLAWWPLSVVDLIWPHELLVLWVQDLAMVAAEVVAFRWMCEVISRPRRHQVASWWPSAVAALGVLMLVANPWTYWSLSFDLHIEPLACPFIIAAAFDLSRARYRRAWVWVAITLLFGDVMASWILGLALSALLAAWAGRDRHLLRVSALLSVVGLAWLALASAVSGTNSVLAASYGYVVAAPGEAIPSKVTLPAVVWGAILHPLRVLHVFWSHVLNVLGDIAPFGWLGLFTPWTIGVPLVVLFANNTSAFGGGVFSAPNFQSAPVFGFVAVGSIILLTWLFGDRIRPSSPLVIGVVAALALNAIAWGAVFIPPVKTTWLRVSRTQAQVLASIDRRVPRNDEIVVSQGVVGRFATRPQVYDLLGGTRRVPVVGGSVWFVIVPNSGIQVEPVDAALSAIGQLAGPMHATLIEHSSGVWAFRWKRPAGVSAITFGELPSTVPGWTSVGPAGSAQLAGPASRWRVAATGGSGYLVKGDYWRRPTGHYQIRVGLSTATTVYVEVWDDNGGQLLLHAAVPPTNELTRVTFPLDVQRSYPPIESYKGWGPLRIDPVPAPPGEVLEIRILNPQGGVANVYNLSLWSP